ncbi:MAG: hypothetical protein EA355_15875 [Rhodobacteraceae bacterium]|nr:MAG: hypothetical protein EA355_15875 [Paracoccaceae bacterium]
MRATIWAAAAALAAGAAQAETCAVTYPEFEADVPHIDLDACPPALAGEDRFCRAVTGEDVLHVFAFSYDGDFCLLAMATLEAGEFRVTFE